jgi:hypothetical protein
MAAAGETGSVLLRELGISSWLPPFNVLIMLMNFIY